MSTDDDDDDVVIALTTLAKTNNMDMDDVEDHQTTTSNATATSGGVSVKTSRAVARRGKIKMEKMEIENNLLVTFSKRKSGLMKKVNELCTMCGVESALVIFSPGGKVFSFGHPSVDRVADRYLSANPNPIFGQQNNHYETVAAAAAVGNHHQEDDAVMMSTEDLISELRELEAALEAAKKHGKELEDKRAMRMRSYCCWWERPLQELNVGQRETLKRAMVDLKSKVFEMAKLLRVMPPPALPVPAPGPGSSARSSLFPPLLSLGSLGSLNNYYPAAADFHVGVSFGGFPTWNSRNNNQEPNNNNDEAGPSGHASGGSLCGAVQ